MKRSRLLKESRLFASYMFDTGCAACSKIKGKESKTKREHAFIKPNVSHADSPMEQQDFGSM